MSECGAFFVYGCYGTLAVEAGTGKVLRYESVNSDEPEYADIARIDILSYEAITGFRINPGDHVSIMDFGFWSHDGQHFVPDNLTILPNTDGKGDWPMPDAICQSKKSGQPDC